MIGRGMVIAGVLGVVLTHRLSSLPSYAELVLLILLALSAVIAAFFTKLCRKPVFIIIALLLFAFSIGLVYSSLLAKQRLSAQLLDTNVDRVSRVTLRVTGLPKLSADRISFSAHVISSHPSGVPADIRVGWSFGGWRGPYAKALATELPDVHAGQVWQMALILRPVSASQNLNLFDYEAYSFAAGVRALGTVRGEPEFIGTDYWHDLSTVSNRARHLIRKAMAPYLEGLRYGPVLRALAIGDQDGVADEDWLVFNRSGLTHLVSISGSHITMLSGSAAILIYLIWCRARRNGRILAEYFPAKMAAAWVAMLVAWVYSLLAGWEVPAQRTFMMLAVVAISQVLQLRLSGSRVLALAAVIVILFDPWAVLASGFWLSFIAVGVLLAVGAMVAAQTSNRGTGPGVIQATNSDKLLETPANTNQKSGVDNSNSLSNKKWFRSLKLAARLQIAVTFALAPALAWIFHEVSLVSPFANAYAIPVIELLVTPLSLLLALFSLIPGCQPVAGFLSWLAHAVLNFIMVPTEWLASLPTLNVPAGPAWIYLLASAGVIMALWPNTKLRRSYLGWLAMLPMAVWSPARPMPGEWHMHALDVGQGSAIVIRTAKHTFLFDAGPRHNRDSDQGARTIVPFLYSLGIKKLDLLVASHVDLDHTGGVRSILKALPVQQSLSSFAIASWLQHESKKLGETQTYLPLADNYCVYGMNWHIDGVSFEFLWPLDIKQHRTGKAANAASCVLRVRGKYHSLLLTGDIGITTEAVLVDRGLSSVDIVIAGHHGSRTSSSQSFVDAVKASHVVMQSGRWNRNGHPHAAVTSRWQSAGTKVWRTDMQGGVNAISHKTDLKVYSVIDEVRRYWHGR